MAPSSSSLHLYPIIYNCPSPGLGLHLAFHNLDLDALCCQRWTDRKKNGSTAPWHRHLSLRWFIIWKERWESFVSKSVCWGRNSVKKSVPSHLWEPLSGSAQGSSMLGTVLDHNVLAGCRSICPFKAGKLTGLASLSTQDPKQQWQEPMDMIGGVGNGSGRWTVRALKRSLELWPHGRAF